MAILENRYILDLLTRGLYHGTRRVDSEGDTADQVDLGRQPIRFTRLGSFGPPAGTSDHVTTASRHL